MIYHYCEVRYAKRAVKDGRLKVHPVRVSEHMDAHDMQQLDPVVWFTTSEEIPPSVLISTTMMYLGQQLRWVRFCCADEVAPLTLSGWSDKRNYSPHLFAWMVKSAAAGGDYWGDWRLAEADVTRELWQRVELFNGKEWVPVDLPAGT